LNYNPSTGALGIGTIVDIIPYDTINSGTLSFEGSAGQLFSITNNLTSGSIFSVNDVSGIPSIDVNADGTIQLAPYEGNIGIGTTNPVAKLHIGAGTTLIAPLELNPGPVLTTPLAGTIEYDGNTIWATPTTSFGRASIAPEIFVSGAGPSIAVASDESVTAPIFPAGNDNIVLPVGTYRINFKIKITRPASTTTATLRLILNNGAATAAVGTFTGRSVGNINASSTTAATFVFFDVTALTTATAVTATNATSAGSYNVWVDGLLRITTAGNFLPSFSLSANLAPGSGSLTLDANNWMSIRQLSSNGAAIFTGAWHD
jgi:hypothetical protein